MDTALDEALSNFLEQAQALVDGYFEKIGAPDKTLSLSIAVGYRFAKVEAREGPNAFRGFHERRLPQNYQEYDRNFWTWGFIDISNGDCLKAASWKSPSEKTPRGNIYDPHLGCFQVTWSGFSPIKNGTGLPRGVREGYLPDLDTYLRS